MKAFPIALLFLAVAHAAEPRWLDVPYVEQEDKAGCGAAVVAMIVQYWARQNPALTTEHVVDDLKPWSRSGIEGRALKKYLEGRGFQAFIFNGEVGDLDHHLRKGRPVVVCFGPKGARGPLHYAVVVGIGGGEVWLNDPARGKLVREDLTSFRAEWKRTRNWALLAVPHAP